jgi:uncharacterized membrane protein
MTEPAPPVPDAVAGNIDTVLEMERHADSSRSSLSKLAHMMGDLVGSIAFAAVHLAAFALWLLLNSGLWPHTVFDPYPFALLGTLVSCEAVVLTTFVLIKQNREGERAETRSHLDLQVNLLTEREVTKILQLVQRLSEQAGLTPPDDGELDEMLEETTVRSLATHLEDRSVGTRKAK